ncbi:hypothetical protein DACRYDRAFT_23234 [Dacryopinax primogenitus]|uniref:DUF7598 domain-containing protein n=1 Tax=Dacryopinax primogenitus (strain DJM 731) TaxID=1858805 RepID=M5FX43_DACPD|nr:uncharacterized protein DACRYDRAFT_23234 [Dacryopinax primogenitus]EJU00295.1 hypothetical protein DACRYDRAFT_23234 [Dacryopinax primogenitus]
MSPFKMISSVKETAWKYLLFNGARFFSILTLLLVFSSNILVMYQDIQAIRDANSGAVTSGIASSNSTLFSNTTMSMATDEFVECDYLEYSTVPNQPAGAFWAILNRLFILFQCLILLWSELGFYEHILKEYMPILGPDFGVWTLGAMQCMISAVVLSHHVDEFPLVSAFFLFAVGCLNIIIGLGYRAKMKEDRILFNFLGKTKSNIKSGLPLMGSDDDDDKPARPAFLRLSGIKGKISNPIRNTQSDAELGSYGYSERMQSWGFGRQGQKAAEYQGAMVSEPVASLPKYAGSPPGSPKVQKAAIEAVWQYKGDSKF